MQQSALACSFRTESPDNTEKNTVLFQHDAIIESVINNMFCFAVYMKQIGIGLLELLFHCPSWMLNSGCQMLCRIQHYHGGFPL